MSRVIPICTTLMLAACGGVDTEALNPQPTPVPATQPPPAPDPEMMPPPQMPPPQMPPPQMPPPQMPPPDRADVHCVSEFIDYVGSTYQFDLSPNGAEATIRLQRVTLPSGTAIDSAETPPPEVFFEQTAPFNDDHFVWLFEVGDFGVGINHGFDRGIGSARMARFDPERELLIEAETTHIAMTCFKSTVELPASYDSATGECLDAEGQPAMNEVPAAFVVATGQGQCVRIEGSLNGEAYGYPIFRDLDLRGADLTQAELSFAHLHQARLEGAQLGSFQFGYAYIDGTIDEYTQLPERSCNGGADGNHYRCLR